MILRWGWELHHKAVSYIMKYFWEVFPLKLLSAVSSFDFPTVTDMSKGEGLWVLLNVGIFPNVFFYFWIVHLNDKQKTNEEFSE